MRGNGPAPLGKLLRHSEASPDGIEWFVTKRTKVGVIGKNKQLSDAHAHVDEKVGREGTAKSYASTTLVVSVLLHLLLWFQAYILLRHMVYVWQQQEWSYWHCVYVLKSLSLQRGCTLVVSAAAYVIDTVDSCYLFCFPYLPKFCHDPTLNLDLTIFDPIP